MLGSVLESFVVTPMKDANRSWESMVYLHYILQENLDWSLDFEIEAEGLFSLRSREIHNKLKIWSNEFKEEKLDAKESG